METRWRVLVVCSLAECRQKLESIVASWKLESVAAATVRDAQRILKEQPVSMVFCEDTLPDGSFRDLVRAIAASRSRIFLVVLLHDEQQYADAIRLGAFDAIPFRYRPSDIRWLMFHAIRHAEETRRPADETRRLVEQRKTA